MFHYLTPVPFYGDYASKEEWLEALDKWFDNHVQELEQANQDYANSFYYKLFFWKKPPQIEIPTKKQFLNRLGL